ncbi:MAG: M1 family peptidase [Bacteroidetes bacterium]|nr:MAG: M1 family peptidase [Bacteroidota bacterium]
MKKTLLTALLAVWGFSANAEYWQQSIAYKMEIKMQAEKNQFTGKQEVKYQNNSPQTLNKVYFHLYFNAFQPNSEMDIRSRSLPDPDRRVGDRIQHLKPEEQGYQRVLSLKQNGKALNYAVQGTILEVELAEPIKPGKSVRFEMEFEAQVPLQVRRSGRDNAEGVRFSMTQWYPKMVEYDADGWHTDPYIGREFHGVWGDFDVTIHMDSAYTIGATGHLQNPEEIGKGYLPEGKKLKRKSGSTLSWNFKASNVHDFAWAADPDYVHYTKQVPNGATLHFIYQPDSLTDIYWPQLGDYMVKAMQVMNENFGVYAYSDYSFIQGGDGGMEYPMLTLITGKRKLGSLVGVSVHEMNHSWFQGMLGFDESHYYWMDEGFTEYSGDVVMGELFESSKKDAFVGAYKGYLSIAGSSNEQPLSTHADWFKTNKAYGIAAYNKGSVFLSQLKYLVGDSLFKASMLEFFNTWKHKHPTARDLKLIFEKNSGLELDWYFEQWINTTHTIDYGISSVVERNGELRLHLKRIGDIPMPLEVEVYFTDGTSSRIRIALDVMRDKSTSGQLPDWKWVEQNYRLSMKMPDNKSVKAIVLDPDSRLADVDRENNIIILE